MAKLRRTLSVSLPGYIQDRSQWRRDIHNRVREVAKKRGVQYGPDDLLEVVVLLYLKEGKREAIHDVDNRLKDILDALQGRFGSSSEKECLIENDNKVRRVVMEKQKVPKLLGPEAGGRLLIRPYEPRAWPLQRTKGVVMKRRRAQAPE